MSKQKQFTDQDMIEISEKSGVDPDVLKSWYKGMFFKINKKNYNSNFN